MQMTSKLRSGSIIGGSVLILVGLLALLGQLFRGFDFWGVFWPFLVIGMGALFFVGMLLGGKQVAGLAIPGTIITGLGLLTLLQNLTGYWETWSYGWTVIIILVGLGIYIMGVYSGQAHTRASGVSVMKVGLVLLIIFGAFFELIFSAGHTSALRQMVFPAALILLGLYLVVVRSGLLPRRSKELPGQAENKPQDNP
jgi:hypothetical protein